MVRSLMDDRTLPNWIVVQTGGSPQVDAAIKEKESAMNLKYPGILLANSVLLFLLVYFGVDDLEIILSDSVLAFQTLKVMAVTIISIFAIAVTVLILDKKGRSKKTKLKYAIVVTLIISSLLYFEYAEKILNNRLLYAAIRSEIPEKISQETLLFKGYRASDLSLAEYNEISKSTFFPAISDRSQDIDLHYMYDGFLPDYLFVLNYSVPIDERIEPFRVFENDVRKTKTVKIMHDKKLIEYSEMVM